MPTCKNCGYELVLLSNRLKYKCALCSRLYPQKEVEAKEFLRKNKLQRELDIQTIKVEYEKEWKQFKEIRKGVERLFNGFPPSMFKKYTQNRKERIKLRLKRDKTYNHKLKQRLAYWRTKQKELALLFLRNNKQEASNDSIFQTPFAFSLSYLLTITKVI